MSQLPSLKVLLLILAAIGGIAASITAYTQHQEQYRQQRAADEAASRQKLLDAAQRAREATIQTNQRTPQKAVLPKLP